MPQLTYLPIFYNYVLPILKNIYKINMKNTLIVEKKNINYIPPKTPRYKILWHKIIINFDKRFTKLI